MTRLPEKAFTNSHVLLSVTAAGAGLFEDRSTPTLVALLVATGGIGLVAPGAIAQSVTDGGLGQSLTVDPVSGQVQIDNNAFDIQTGPLDNTSNIPLPSSLPTAVQEGVPLEVDRARLAPNTIEISPDINYIDNALEGALDRGSGNATTYMLNTDSLELSTEFDLNQRVGSHDYGEGIEAIIVDENGAVTSRESVFVRGEEIEIGPDGEPLPQSNRLVVEYRGTDTVNLRVLNLRENGAPPEESGIYFTRDGEFIVEDIQDGGDLDFDDGEYLEISNGRGEAEVIETQVVDSVETRTTETDLPPIVRERRNVEREVIETIQEMDAAVDETVEWGSVETPDARALRLAHSTRASTEAGDQLIYTRYAAANQIRAGSDGFGITGQLAPLVNNPNVPPTLLSGNLTYNPFVGNNQAGLTATVGLTQFLNPTHRQAQDEFGNDIVNPDGSSRRLLEPTGLFNNRQLVGYVPPAPPEQIFGEAVSSVNGIFELPADQPVFVGVPDPQQVGRGNAGYTDNVGGLLIEGTDGSLAFVPQWTAAGYAQEPLSLAAGEASRIIYALVPQQPGQNLQIGQSYAVTSSGSTYEIADGGFTIISADRQPQNFVQEMEEVYAVEDTLSDRPNAVTSIFNGIPGIYAEQFGGVRVPTVDVGLASEADARVGNTLFPLESVVTNPGQGAYAETTVAAGFYLGGSLTGGIGNQENVINRATTAMDLQVEELRTRTTISTLEIARRRTEIERVAVSRTTEQVGTAFFNINERGQLTNVRFEDGEVIDVDRTEDVLDTQRRTRRVGERLIDQRIEDEFELRDSQLIMGDTTTSRRRESAANFSPVQGELALGGVLNFGNTPWTPAANTLRTELFLRDTVFGRSNSGSEVGWRAEVIFHPFGEAQREAYQYDSEGNVIPVYQTQPLLDASGKQVMETLTGVDNRIVEVPVNEFVVDEAGDRIAQTVGTGISQGPAVYLRIEDAFDDDDGALIAGGIQFSF